MTKNFIDKWEKCDIIPSFKISHKNTSELFSEKYHYLLDFFIGMVYNVLAMKNYYITNIDWDTTDSVEEMDIIELPTEVLIQADDEDSIADALSDEYGFCVNSFDYDILGIKTIRRLVKEGILYFDFSDDAEDDKKWLEEHGDTYTEDYSYNKVEEIVSISDDDFARREFPRKSHDGCLIFNAENVDYMITKCNKILITGTNTFKIKDNGYRPGDYWNMAIRKDFV